MIRIVLEESGKPSVTVVVSPGPVPEIRVIQAEGARMETSQPVNLPALPVAPALPAAVPVSLPADAALQKDGGPWDACVARYLEWGKAFGGREGGWAERHAVVVEAHLREWKKWLGVASLAEIRLEAVEKALITAKNQDRGVIKRDGARGGRKKGEAKGAWAPATLKRYFDSLRGLLTWARKREIISHHPLMAAAPVTARRKKICRDLKPVELYKLFAAEIPAARKLLYKTAYATALRKGELAALTPAHLHHDFHAVKLEAAWTKDRKERLHPLPKDLFAELVRAAEGKADHEALLGIPERAFETFRADLAAAGVAADPKDTDFRCLRHTAITRFRRQTGVSRSDARQFSRHASDQMLANYDHADIEIVRRAQELMWKEVEKDMVEVRGIEPLTFRLPVKNARDLQRILLEIPSDSQLTESVQSDADALNRQAAAADLGLLVAWFWQLSRERQRAVLVSLDIQIPTEAAVTPMIAEGRQSPQKPGNTQSSTGLTSGQEQASVAAAPASAGFLEGGA